MNADASIFQAAAPESFRILGLQLKPLSIGRYRMMKRHDIAFVADGDTTAGAKDLILGVLICSQRVDDFNAWLELPADERAKDLKRWGDKVAGRWVRKKDVPDLVAKAGEFRAYIAEHSYMPSYWNEVESDRTPTGHWSHQIEIVLRSEIGWTRDEINEEPLPKAMADYFKWAENNGLIRLMTPEEIEMGESNARIWEQMMAGGNN